MTKHITDLIQGIIQVRMFEAGRKTVDRYNEEADVYAVKSDKRNMFHLCLNVLIQALTLYVILYFWHLEYYSCRRAIQHLVLLRRYIQCMDAFQGNFADGKVYSGAYCVSDICAEYI